MAKKKAKKDKRRLLKRRARPLAEKHKKKAPPPTAARSVHTTASTPSSAEALPARPTEESTHAIERIEHYIRHRPDVRMDDLARVMGQKYDMTEAGVWSAVRALEARRSVRIHYPAMDRGGAIVSALW